MIADAVGAILLAAVTLYALFGGADFGAGFWDLFAGGARRGRAPRALIDESITPVWEANHVWLIFALVIFWTAFPNAYTAVLNVTALPLWLAVGGVVLRGAGFAFRKEVWSLRLQRATGAAFALSSLLTPFFMGTVIGAIATGHVPAGARHASLAAWTNATSLLLGFLFVGACAYLAAVYLVDEAASRGEPALERYFARRAQIMAVIAGALSLATLAELHGSNRALFDRLTGRALPLVIVSAACGVVVIVLLGVHQRIAARFVAAAGVAAVVWGWGVAQYPVLLPGTGVTLQNAGAPQATLVAIVVVFVALVVLVGPPFVLLFNLQQRRVLQHGEDLPAPHTNGVWRAAVGQPAAAGPREVPASGRLVTFVVVAVVAFLRRRRSR